MTTSYKDSLGTTKKRPHRRKTAYPSTADTEIPLHTLRRVARAWLIYGHPIDRVARNAKIQIETAHRIVTAKIQASAWVNIVADLIIEGADVALGHKRRKARFAREEAWAAARRRELSLQKQRKARRERAEKREQDALEKKEEPNGTD